VEELSKSFEHANLEDRWYEWWNERGYFRAADVSEKPPYCIVIPPPNVTGVLHMGHALTCTIQDILTRWRRMQGYNALWLPGTDHAGIATQMVVERDLKKTCGQSRFDLGRHDFIEKVWEWKRHHHGAISKQLGKLGASVDWERERFTLDEGFSRAVRQVFVSLYKEGLIYRDQRMVNWSPGIRTVLSDLEVETREVDGRLWHIRYPVEGSDEALVVATTRPETMLGDAAVAVHPDDPRYTHLHGKRVRLPLTDRTIPIICDADAVDMSFGTGALKITPAHDFTDFEVARRHDLPRIVMLNLDASLSDECPERFRGLDRYEARKRVVAELVEQGLLVKEEPYKLMLGHCQRSGVPVEPMVSYQWFVKVEPLAREAIRVVEEGHIRFVPEHWTRTYYAWMTNIRDWCISRQLWWGHQIPVWYCDECGHITVSMQDATACEKCQSTRLRQEEDVLDTWFSSALWPFGTLGWPDRTEALQTFYPNAVMETGFDILFFWVARMIMMGTHFMQDVPFRSVYLHAMVRDEKGDKMSKTKGNVIDPLELIDEFGADALRFTLAAFTAQGREIKLAKERVAGYRTFVNKLWNASRFIGMNLTDFVGEAGGDVAPRTPTLDQSRSLLDPAELGLTDRWILTRLQRATAEVTRALEEFRFNDAASLCYSFAWHAFCDWYIEFAKPDLAKPERRRAVQKVLVHVLDQLLKLLHPFMPFITEELWQKFPKLGAQAESIMISSWPTPDATLTFAAEEAQVELLTQVIGAVRTIRGETGIAPSAMVKVEVVASEPVDAAMVALVADQVKALARAEAVEVLAQPAGKGRGSAVIREGLEVYVPLAGLVDLDGEARRIRKIIDKAGKDVEILSRKLGNPGFVANAPEEVVEKDRARLAELQGTVARYTHLLAFLA
jgi:valyl-tRNA synthetase